MVRNKQRIFVSQKAVVYRDDGRILALRRSETAPSRPLYWDLPGGELDIGEDVKIGIAREIKEESEIEAEDIQVLDVIAKYNDIEEYWLTVGYSARARSESVVLSFEHDDYKWVTPDEFLALKASPRNLQFVEIFKKVHGA